MKYSNKYKYGSKKKKNSYKKGSKLSKAEDRIKQLEAEINFMKRGGRMPYANSYADGGEVVDAIGSTLYGLGEGVLDTLTFGATDSLTDQGYEWLRSEADLVDVEYDEYGNPVGSDTGAGLRGIGNTVGAVGGAYVNPAAVGSAVTQGTKGAGDALAATGNEDLEKVGKGVQIAGQVAGTVVGANAASAANQAASGAGNAGEAVTKGNKVVQGLQNFGQGTLAEKSSNVSQLGEKGLNMAMNQATAQLGKDASKNQREDFLEEQEEERIRNLYAGNTTQYTAKYGGKINPNINMFSYGSSMTGPITDTGATNSSNFSKQDAINMGTAVASQAGQIADIQGNEGLTPEQKSDQTTATVNAIADTVITALPGGQFYGLAKAGSDIISDQLGDTHIDQETGEQIKTYDSEAAAVADSWVKPTHTNQIDAAMDIFEGEEGAWERGFWEFALPGIGSAINAQSDYKSGDSKSEMIEGNLFNPNIARYGSSMYNDYAKGGKADFEPHMMYDPKTGKGYKANTYEDHLRMNEMGYNHEMAYGGNMFNEYKAGGGYTVTRSNDRKGKTHKVVRNSDGKTEYYGYPGMGEKENSKLGKKAFRSRHAKNLKNNPFFRAYANATWEYGGVMNEYEKGGKLPEEVLRSRVESHMSKKEADNYVNNYKAGGMLKRADGSYSQRGFWDNIRTKAEENKKSGTTPKEPTKEMKKQERKIKANEKAYGGNMYNNDGFGVNTMNQIPVNEFRAGGTHEANPLGGIPQGIGANGAPNLVEEGELKIPDPRDPSGNASFIVSAQKDMKITKPLAEKYNLPKKYIGKTVRKAADMLLRKNDVFTREGDIIQQNSIDQDMIGFMEAHEELTAMKEAKEEESFNKEMNAIAEKYPQQMQAAMPQEAAPQGMPMGMSPEQQMMMMQQGAPQGIPMAKHGGKIHNPYKQFGGNIHQANPNMTTTPFQNYLSTYPDAVASDTLVGGPNWQGDPRESFIYAPSKRDIALNKAFDDTYGYSDLYPIERAQRDLQDIQSSDMNIDMKSKYLKEQNKLIQQAEAEARQNKQFGGNIHQTKPNMLNLKGYEGYFDSPTEYQRVIDTYGPSIIQTKGQGPYDPTVHNTNMMLNPHAIPGFDKKAKEVFLKLHQKGFPNLTDVNDPKVKEMWDQMVIRPIDLMNYEATGEIPTSMIDTSYVNEPVRQPSSKKIISSPPISSGPQMGTQQYRDANTGALLDADEYGTYEGFAGKTMDAVTRMANTKEAKEKKAATEAEIQKNTELLKTMTESQKADMRSKGLTPNKFLEQFPDKIETPVFKYGGNIHQYNPNMVNYDFGQSFPINQDGPRNTGEDEGFGMGMFGTEPNAFVRAMGDPRNQADLSNVKLDSKTNKIINKAEDNKDKQIAEQQKIVDKEKEKLDLDKSNSAKQEKLVYEQSKLSAMMQMAPIAMNLGMGLLGKKDKINLSRLNPITLQRLDAENQLKNLGYDLAGARKAFRNAAGSPGAYYGNMQALFNRGSEARGNIYDRLNKTNQAIADREAQMNLNVAARNAAAKDKETMYGKQVEQAKQNMINEAVKQAANYASTQDKNRLAVLYANAYADNPQFQFEYKPFSLFSRKNKNVDETGG